jgi:hypothetical protein
MVFVFLIGLYNIPANLFQCAPIRQAWDFTANGKCLNQMALWITQSAFHVLTDVMIFILPLPLIAKSQMPIRQKTQALIIFALGMILVIASVIKLNNNVRGMTLTPEEMKDFGCKYTICRDRSFRANSLIGGASPAMAWVTMEVNLGIIVACLPGIRPILGRIFPTWFVDYSGNSSSAQTPSPIQFRSKASAQPSSTATDREVFQVVVVDEEGRTGELEVRETEKSGRRKSFMHLLKEGKVIKMTLLKSNNKNGSHLGVGVNGDSQQDIVARKDEEVV